MKDSIFDQMLQIPGNCEVLTRSDELSPPCLESSGGGSRSNVVELRSKEVRGEGMDIGAILESWLYKSGTSLATSADVFIVSTSPSKELEFRSEDFGQTS